MCREGPHLLGQGFQGFLRLVPGVGVWDEAQAYLMAGLLCLGQVQQE